MEEVQSWWEVPAIAHFCCVFRAAFHLLYFDVGELEAAILNMQDPEMSISLEQLIMKLLQGCFDKGEVTTLNWVEKLREIFDEHKEDDDDENPLTDSNFHSLDPRSKVEILFKLCHIRLDIAVMDDAIKDMPAENMQAKCIGKDSEKYSYWYFNDERLYKENPSKTEGNSKKQIVSKSKKSPAQPVKNGKRQSARDKKITPATTNNKSAWSIVCHNLSDWETLEKKFSKSKSTLEKELAKEIKDNYLSKISLIINEKERLLRKRYLELAPKRTSSRISKVQAQKKLEEQLAQEAEEQRRQKYEKEQEKREALKKQEVKESRQKRAEERSKIIEERARRAHQRGMNRNFIDDYEDSNSNDNFKRTYNDVKIEEHSNSDSESQDSESEEEEKADVKSESQTSSSEEEEDSRESYSDSNESSGVCSKNGNNLPTFKLKGQQNVSQDVLHTYDLTKWNSSIQSGGNKLRISRSPPDNVSENKRLKLNEGGSYKVSKINGFNSTTHKENQTLSPFQIRNYKTYGDTQRTGIIRIDFLKPAAKPTSS